MWKDILKALKDAAKAAWPTAFAALIGYAIARVRKETLKLQAETQKPAPQPPVQRRRARRHRHR